MIAFYFDIACPYAYMAFYRLHRDNLFVKKRIELKPILLELLKLLGEDGDPKIQISSLRAAYIREDILRQADLWSVPLHFSFAHPQSSAKAMRLLTACSKDRQEELSAYFYASYWQHGVDINDDDFLNQVAHEFGIKDLSLAQEVLRATTTQAFEDKVFGVPTLKIKNRLYFGSDRLSLIKSELGLAEPEPRWGKSTKTLDFYFDFSSPYSYLAHIEMQKAKLCGQKVRYIPVLLGALFQELGLDNLPLFKAPRNKINYLMLDMADWALARQAAFKFSSYFPLRSLNALRMALIEPQVIPSIFAAAWALDLDIGQEQVLIDLLNKAGFDGLKLLAATKDHEIKEKLKANTAKALSLGVFGLPSFIIDDKLVFGQDRFLWLSRELCKENTAMVIGSQN